MESVFYRLTFGRGVHYYSISLNISRIVELLLNLDGVHNKRFTDLLNLDQVFNYSNQFYDFHLTNDKSLSNRITIVS